MAVRIIVGLLAAVFAIAIIFFAPAWLICIIMMMICVIACVELLYTTSIIKNKRMIFISLLFSGIVPIWVFTGSDLRFLEFYIFVFVSYFLCELLINHKTLSFLQVTSGFFAGFVVPYFLCSMFRIYLMPYGEYLVVIPMICAWMSDSLAMFAGMFFGKHKLAPDISPKKTVEGSIGGVVGAILGMFIYSHIVLYFAKVHIPYVWCMIIGLFGSIIGQLGDLSFSIIKRQSGIKDYGNVLPGHGGILDRCDSVIFTAPIAEIILNYISLGL